MRGPRRMHACSVDGLHGQRGIAAGVGQTIEVLYGRLML